MLDVGRPISQQRARANSFVVLRETSWRGESDERTDERGIQPTPRTRTRLVPGPKAHMPPRQSPSPSLSEPRATHRTTQTTHPGHKQKPESPRFPTHTRQPKKKKNAGETSDTRNHGILKEKSTDRKRKNITKGVTKRLCLKNCTARVKMGGSQAQP